jgi:hypothetical protein
VLLSKSERSEDERHGMRAKERRIKERGGWAIMAR